MKLESCPNCESVEIQEQFTIRGVAIKEPDELTPRIVSYDRETLLFTECKDCGFRW